MAGKAWGAGSRGTRLQFKRYILECFQRLSAQLRSGIAKWKGVDFWCLTGGGGARVVGAGATDPVIITKQCNGSLCSSDVRWRQNKVSLLSTVTGVPLHSNHGN